MVLPDATGNPHDQPSSGSLSPRASSSAARPPPAPCYLSARSADVILSEIRPTRIKTEALRSVNVLLDELLWLILGSARSFSPERLRTGLLKVLPTALGKDALLEAEFELRAYTERHSPASPLPTDEVAIQRFPLQQAFELLRIKCEAHSSLGDQEENIENETVLYARMVQITGDATPKLAAVTPASLYLTAILERVCEHVLSNVGRVVARDSSRTTAHCQDLYVALCEDESIYSLFKTMKVQEQIEQQSKPMRPQRSKSFSRNDLVTETIAAGASTDSPALPKQRQSYDSTVSNGSNPNLPNRVSVDKGRGKVIFKTSSRTVGDHGNTNTDGAKHHRTNSLLGDKTPVTLPTDAPEMNAEDDDEMQDFDDLMRSGTTMKVSLTPDRLKTFEFAKEKNQRVNRPGVAPSITSPPSSFSNGQKGSLTSRSRSQVESIAEAPEGDPVRLRAASITHPTPPQVDKVIPLRSRSFTDARAPSTPPSNIQTDNPPTYTQTMSVAMFNSSTGIPKQTRRRPSRNRESIDLDDLMDESDDDMIVPPKKIPLTPKAAQATESGTRELMDFLSEGPPEPPSIVTPPSSTAISDSRGTKQGRFRTIVSRLTGAASSERLSPRFEDPYSDPFQRPSINGYSAPSRAPLLSKKSVPNVAAAARPMPLPPSPSADSTAPASGLRTRQLSLSRKAVPTWEALQEKAEPPVPQKSIVWHGESTNVMKALPQSIMTLSPQPSAGDNPEPMSPTRRRAPPDVEQPDKGSVPRDIEQPTKGCAPRDVEQPTKDSAPRDVEQPAKRNAQPDLEQPTKDDAIAEMEPSSTIVSISTAPTSRHTNLNQEPVTPRGSKPPDLTLSIPAGDHVRDFRRLMNRATSADECRILVEMFLAKCGVLPTDGGHLSVSITPPSSPAQIEVDSHEADLIEVLLGDSGISTLLPAAVKDSQPGTAEPTEEHSSQLPTVTTNTSVEVTSTA